MNIEIANRLQKLRKENGYSQEELADKLGISRQAVSKWERAESSPDTDNLIILARLYGMSLDELLYDNESDEEIKQRSKDKESESGIHIEDNGDSIHITNDGIKLTDDEGQTLSIEKNHIRFINKDGSEEHYSKKKTIVKSTIDGLVVFATLIAFLLWGFNGGWYISWVLWIFMPALMSIVEVVMKKQITAFIFPCLIAGIYCYIGMQYNLWHPWWWLFFLIPVFYIVFEPIDKYVFKTKEVEDK